MAQQHIISGLGESLGEINDLILSMGDLALSQFQAVMASIDSGDEAAMVDLIAQDSKIDDMEVALNSKAIETIALHALYAEDLRKVFVAIKMAQILERIGDYAANIAKRNRVLLKDEDGTGSSINADLSELGMMASGMLVDAMDAYRHQDEEKALAVWSRDVEIDERYNKITQSVIHAMDGHDIAAASGTQYIFIVKNIERIGDFATGIAEQVYFLLHAEPIEASRPKA